MGNGKSSMIILTDVSNVQFGEMTFEFDEKIQIKTVVVTGACL